MMQWIGWLGTAGTVIITVISFYIGWQRFQAESQRSRDVAAWADRSIALLVTVEVCARPASPIAMEERVRRLTDAYFTASILTEQGRLFFPNVEGQRTVRRGQTYSGLRPRLLDPLVIAHKAAARMLTEADAVMHGLHKVLVRERREFVKHVQVEIGRRRAAARDSRLGGATSDLDSLIREAADH